MKLRLITGIVPLFFFDPSSDTVVNEGTSTGTHVPLGEDRRAVVEHELVEHDRGA